MPFSRATREQALISAGRCCCICHRFCGLKIECHHILPEADGGDNTLENCIPVCFDCHADQLNYDPNHPRGTKYSPEELQQHRDAWFRRVARSPGPEYGGDARRLDVAVYETIAKMLPWNGAIEILGSFELFGYAIPVEASRELSKFARRNAVDPSFEFIDADLEHCRVSLMNALNVFLDVKFEEMFSTKDGVNLAIPREWKLSQPDRYYSAAEKLETAASELCEAYDNLVRLARRKLRDDIAHV